MRRILFLFTICQLLPFLASGSWNALPGTQKVFIRKNIGDPASGRPAIPIPPSTLIKWGAVVVDDRDSYMVVQVPQSHATGLVADLKNLTDLAEIRDDFDRLDFRSFPIDSRLPAPVYPAKWTRAALPPPSRDAFLVQFATVSRQEFRSAIDAAGAEIVGYVPANGYLVFGASDRLQQVAAREPIQLLRLYQPIQKVSTNLRNSAQVFLDVTVQIAKVPESADALAMLAANTLSELGPVEDSGDAEFHRVTVSAESLPAIAARPAVISIEPFLPAKPSGEREAHLVAGDILVKGTVPGATLKPETGNYRQWIADRGINYIASGVKIAILDTGFDKGSSTDVNPDFKINASQSSITVVDYTNTGGDDSDCYGHGTHVAGVITGNAGAGAFTTSTKDIGSQYGDADYLMGLGMAPAVPLVSGRIFNYVNQPGPSYDPLPFGTIFADLVNRSVAITSNSWNDQSDTSYSSDSQIFDKLVRSANSVNGGPPMLIFFAAGNQDDGKNQVHAPGTAKNVVTVGGNESFNPIPNSVYPDPFPHNSGVDADSGNDMWIYSCFGPTVDDARIKPDLVAPATAVESTRTRTTVACKPGISPVSTIIDPPSNLHGWSRGTSFAAPSAAGAGALLYSWFKSRAGTTPKPSLLKAMEINFAFDLTGKKFDGSCCLGRPPDPQQGWGKADLTRAFQNDGRYDYVNEGTTLTTGATQNYPASGSYSIKDTSLPVRITLVWTDRFHTTPTTTAINNNLDLKASMGSLYALGNSFNTTTGHSILYSSGGTPDNKNTVEEIIFTAAEAGSSQFTVSVIGTSVPDDAINVWGGTQTARQDYALFIDNVIGGASNGLGTSAPSGLVATATSTSSVDLTWNAAAGATSYTVYSRSLATDVFTVIASNVLSTTYTNNTGLTQDTTYAYEVTAQVGGLTSPASNVDLATTIAFTDPQDPIGNVTVKADHINQLRTAVNAIRTYYSLPAFNGWTDVPIVGSPNLNATVIKGDHVTELRLHLDEAVGPPPVPYSDPGTAPGSLHNVVIKGVHIDELRKRVR